MEPIIKSHCFSQEKLMMEVISLVFEPRKIGIAFGIDA
jgi:hypothetical protein